MSDQTREATSDKKLVRQSFLARRWWVLALVVLIVLLAMIYVLSHLSAADSEMYPTTLLRQGLANFRLC